MNNHTCPMCGNVDAYFYESRLKGTPEIWVKCEDCAYHNKLEINPKDLDNDWGMDRSCDPDY